MNLVRSLMQNIHTAPSFYSHSIRAFFHQPKALFVVTPMVLVLFIALTKLILQNDCRFVNEFSIFCHARMDPFNKIRSGIPCLFSLGVSLAPDGRKIYILYFVIVFQCQS